jgi:hypothetical protein
MIQTSQNLKRKKKPEVTVGHCDIIFCAVNSAHIGFKSDYTNIKSQSEEGVSTASVSSN